MGDCFVRDLLTRIVQQEVGNVVNEVNLKVATFLTEKMIEELLLALDSTLHSLVSFGSKVQIYIAVSSLPLKANCETTLQYRQVYRQDVR